MDDLDLLKAVDGLPKTTWSGRLFRHTALEREPLSGAGSFVMGGRWNPPELVPTIYLADSEEVCRAEFRRMADRQARGVQSFLSRRLHEIYVIDLELVDLTSEASLQAAGLSLRDIADPDWEPCQAVGAAAHFLGLQALMAPSATGSGAVVAVFEPRIRRGQFVVVSSRELTIQA